jgi:hypothetical protein
LRQAVDHTGPALVTAVRAEVGEIEAAYRKYRRRQRIGAGLIATAVIVAQFFSGDSEISWGRWQALIDLIMPIVVILLIPIIGLMLLVGIRFYRAGKAVVWRFHQGVNAVLFRHSFALLGYTGNLVYHHAMSPQSKLAAAVSDAEAQRLLSNELSSAERSQVIDLLHHSELITEKSNYLAVDNLFQVTGAHGNIFVAELEVKNITGSGESRRVKNIFKGYFVSLDLKRALSGKTFVVTEGDEQGFGYGSFWGSRTGDKLKETTLEWNEFEDLLHVATTDEVEARYILTPSFMHDLYDWWKDKKVNIRLAFIANRLYILFPDQAIRLYDTVPKIDEKVLTDYLYSITKPLYHVVCLVEDVKM